MPCPKSVATEVWRCSYVRTSPRVYVARTREVDIGCVRPWRKSSVRCHISFTGLPMAREISAASWAASWNSLRPKEPPPSVTWTRTAETGSPSSSAIFSWATIGALREAQISAESARTSAIAQLVSRAALLAKWKVNRASTALVSSGSGGTTRGSSALRSFARTVASEAPSAVPGPQSTRRARTASMHWPKVRPRTATPVETVTTSVTPGMARTSARLATERTVPLMVGGRQTMVGRASGTWRSIANFLRPVTASRASTRRCPVPMTRNRARSLRVTATAVSDSAAAFAASSP